MKAAILTGIKQPFVIADDVEIDDPKHNELLVRVTHCGVCHSDYSVYEGANLSYPTPVLLGHEAAGVVAKVGSAVTGFAVDQPVAVSMRSPCGHCFQCTRGMAVLCENLSRRNDDGRVRWRGQPIVRGFGLGAFADYVLVEQNAAAPLLPDMPGEIAATLGCAVQTGVGAVDNLAQLKPASTVLVIGAGTVGLCVVQGARIAAAYSIIAIDPVASRREQALAFGATHAFGPEEPNLVERIRAITGGRGVDAAFDVVCASGTAELAIAACRPGGQTILIGASSSTQDIRLIAAEMVLTQKSVMGCLLGNCHPHRDFPKFMQLWRSGRLDLESLVTKVSPLSAIDEAFADLEARRGLRTMLTM